MELIAGIDGGGTKTSVVCQTPEGETLAQKTFGPFNLNGIGEMRFRALLAEIGNFLCTQGDCRALVIGAAGASNPKLASLTANAMAHAGISNWKLMGDHEIALYGALEDRPGCLLIAGTGSICVGKDRRGNIACAGGWGHLIGDRGSGYALGRDALSALARARDGLGGETQLTQLLEQELGLTTREAIVAYAYGGDKGRIAAIAPLVEQAALLDDSGAIQILELGAQELVDLIFAVSRRLHLEQAEVALCGGLLEHKTGLRRLLLKHLRRQMPKLHCVEPRQAAAFGAAQMARELL